jgi:hypothetical protein
MGGSHICQPRGIARDGVGSASCSGYDPPAVASNRRGRLEAARRSASAWAHKHVNGTVMPVCGRDPQVHSFV